MHGRLILTITFHCARNMIHNALSGTLGQGHWSLDTQLGPLLGVCDEISYPTMGAFMVIDLLAWEWNRLKHLNHSFPQSTLHQKRNCLLVQLIFFLNLGVHTFVILKSAYKHYRFYIWRWLVSFFFYKCTTPPIPPSAFKVLWCRIKFLTGCDFIHFE